MTPLTLFLVKGLVEGITLLQIWIECIINRWYFECTSIWTSIIKRLWKVKKMVMVTLKLQRYFVIYKRSPLKMQKIKKPRSPSRQLLETVNFAFIFFFDFLVKIVIFWAFLLFLGDLRHALRPQSNTWSGQNAWHESPTKKEKCPKNGNFD